MILNEKSIAEIKGKLALYPSPKSVILPALTIAYRQVRYLSPEIYQEIAQVTGLSEVDVAGAASFYTMFPKEPVGKYLIQVCHNISCALLGADSLIGYLEQKLEIKKGQTTPDGLFTLISVECLGSCTTAPMMQINEDFYENLTHEKVDRILEDLRGKS